MDTNRFQWKSSFSIRERLRKIPLMLDEGVESHSDEVHRIHWTRVDSDGKVHFLFVRDLGLKNQFIELRSDISAFA